MRKPALYFLVLLLAMQSTAICAQNPEKPKPGFTLTISGGEDSYYKGMYYVSVIETNISNQVIREGGCLPLTYMTGFNIEVVYNGIPLKMDETSPSVQHLRKHQAHPVPCSGSLNGHEAQPGGGPEGAFEDHFMISQYFDMSKPGTYQVTVSKETFPHNPEKSVTVRSNTITIIVPEPKAEAPK
jgi:hypothetical protein